MLDFHIQKKKKKRKEYRDDLTPFTKTNSKWIANLKVKCKTIKLLKENLEENLDGLVSGDDFLDIIPKLQSVKEIIEKIDFIKI